MSAKIKKKVDRTNCSVFGCHTIRLKENQISFHYFPRKNSGFVYITNAFGNLEKIDRRKAWENALKMGKPTSNYMRVCGKHFTKEDYIYELSRKPSLKLTAVPSQNLPNQRLTRDSKKAAVGQRQERHRNRQMTREADTSSSDFQLNCEAVSENHSVHEDENCENPVRTFDELSEYERSAVDVLLHLPVHSAVEHTGDVWKVEKEVQVTSGDLFNSFTSTITSDNHLNSLTGISSFNLLRTITSLVTEYYSTVKSRKLSVQDSIVIVFMKLKLSLKFKVLAILFQISPSTSRLIFNEYVQYLANVLERCIVWPSIDECRANLPNCFKEFRSVRVVLDCIEIPVQKPKCRCCRIKTYSHYKGRNTLKFMTGVSPAGLLTFVSRCYGGRASDKAIFEQSDLIKKLEPHVDSIMVDKGFAINDICNEHFIKLVQPYFLRKKKQFSALEAQKNIRVSRARVHVERANQRIRIFEIFNSPIPWNLVNYINDIFVIACAIVNLQNPILAEDKFN